MINEICALSYAKLEKNTNILNLFFLISKAKILKSVRYKKGI